MTFRGFDDRNDAGILGLLAGLGAGSGLLLMSIRQWWDWGWGPGNWSRSDILDAYFLAFWGHLSPAWAGDLGTWSGFRSWLIERRIYWSFVASFWVPFGVSAVVGLAIGVLVARISARSAATFVRGGKIN